MNKPLSQKRKMETKEALFRSRKRILKYLVQNYLKQEGYMHTAETFASEAGVTEEYQLCDNIDLDIILQDYCSYYLARFNKQPQFCREAVARPPAAPARKTPVHRVREADDVCEEPDLPAALAVTRLLEEESSLEDIPAVERKSLAGFLSNSSPERRQLAEHLYQDIIRPTVVQWDEVKGLAHAKSLLLESVVYPVRHPEVFTGGLEPWRGILLHGPPGTGKTLAARAAATLSRCAFFNVSCGTLASKWRGDPEKIVKLLFEMASYYSPSIIFMDEVESVMSSRSAGDHDASRRVKAQLLIELDGARRGDGLVLLLANSNIPWEIDPAMLRRLEKRIYIPLPDSQTRAELFQAYLSSPNVELTGVKCEELAARTEGYSGSDIKLVCKEVLMAAVRKILPDMTGKSTNTRMRGKVELADILAAIEKTKPVSKQLARRHEEWQAQMGCS